MTSEKKRKKKKNKINNQHRTYDTDWKLVWLTWLWVWPAIKRGRPFGKISDAQERNVKARGQPLMDYLTNTNFLSHY